MINFIRLFVFFIVLLYSAFVCAVPLYIEICGDSTSPENYSCPGANSLYDSQGGSTNSQGTEAIVPDLSTWTFDSLSGVAGVIEIHDIDGSKIAVPVGGNLDVPPPAAVPTIAATRKPLRYCSALNIDGSARHCGEVGGDLVGAVDPLASCIAAGWSELNWFGRCSCPTCGSWESNTGPLPVSFDCPTGYLLAGSNCALISARAAVDDNRQDFVRSGDSFVPYDGDLTGDQTAIVTTTNSANDTVNYSTSSFTGVPVLVTVRALPGGATKITGSTQSIDGTGAAYVGSKSATIGSNGSVTSSTSYTTPGSLTEPGIGTGTSVIFPSDYARSGEAATAAAGLGTKLDGIGTKLDGIGTKLDGIGFSVDGIGSSLSETQTLADVESPAEADMPGWSTTFDNLKGWSLPGHSSVCPQPVFDLTNLGMGSHVFNAHCGIMADVGAVLHQVMVVVFSVMAIFLVLSA